MWNGLDADVVYCPPSELHGSMAYAAEKVVCFAPKRYDPVEIGHFLAEILADTPWAEEAEAWLAGPPGSGQRNVSHTPGRFGPNPLIRPEFARPASTAL